MGPELKQELEQERRWDRLWNLLPYVLLTFATALALVRSEGWGERGVTLAVAAGLAAWHAGWVTAHPEWPERRLAPMAVYYAGLLVFTAGLVRRDPSFLLLAVGCYPAAFSTLPRGYAYVGVAAASVILVGGPTELIRPADPSITYGALILGTLLASGFGAIIRAMEREMIRRREANAELTAANDRLVRLAAENAALQDQLLQRARAAGVASERARLAREIHDTLAQGLAGIATQLEVADEVLDTAHPIRHRLIVARDLAQRSLTEARRAVEALRPGPLENLHLADAVADAVSAWRRQYGVPATFTVTGDPRPIPDQQETVLLRAAQEALSNVGRHADAGRVGVTLSYMEDRVVLDVRDDGRGFAPEGEGFGIEAMRERVEEVAGRVEIDTAPGAGACVSVTVPGTAA